MCGYFFFCDCVSVCACECAAFVCAPCREIKKSHVLRERKLKNGLFSARRNTTYIRCQTQNAKDLFCLKLTSQAVVDKSYANIVFISMFEDYSRRDAFFVIGAHDFGQFGRSRFARMQMHVKYLPIRVSIAYDLCVPVRTQSVLMNFKLALKYTMRAER